MNTKILFMTAIVGGASVLAFAGCSSDDDKASDTNQSGTDAGSTDKDSGGTTTDQDSSTEPVKVDCGSSACAKACEKAVAAACGDAEKIVQTCNNATLGKTVAPSCSDTIDAAIACMNDKATYTCEAGGTKPAGCDDELNAAGTCVQAAFADGGAGDGGADDAGSDGGS